MGESKIASGHDVSFAGRSADELYDLAQKWITEARRASAQNEAEIAAWKKEMQEWGYSMSASARPHRGTPRHEFFWRDRPDRSRR